VALPQARPAIVVGVSLALMECLNDIAAVGFFGVRTLTLGIYTTWLGEGNLGGAAQLAGVLLVFVFALLWVERHARKQQSHMPSSRHHMAARRSALTGWQGILATLACFLPVFLGLILPGFILPKLSSQL
jgi:iron(III) transport system permease protein